MTQIQGGEGGLTSLHFSSEARKAHTQKKEEEVFKKSCVEPGAVADALVGVGAARNAADADEGHASRCALVEAPQGLPCRVRQGRARQPPWLAPKCLGARQAHASIGLTPVGLNPVECRAYPVGLVVPAAAARPPAGGVAYDEASHAVVRVQREGREGIQRCSVQVRPHLRHAALHTATRTATRHEASTQAGEFKMILRRSNFARMPRLLAH